MRWCRKNHGHKSARKHIYSTFIVTRQKRLWMAKPAGLGILTHIFSTQSTKMRFNMIVSGDNLVFVWSGVQALRPSINSKAHLFYIHCDKADNTLDGQTGWFGDIDPYILHTLYREAFWTDHGLWLFSMLFYVLQLWIRGTLLISQITQIISTSTDLCNYKINLKNDCCIYFQVPNKQLGPNKWVG